VQAKELPSHLDTVVHIFLLEIPMPPDSLPDGPFILEGGHGSSFGSFFNTGPGKAACRKVLRVIDSSSVHLAEEMTARSA